ncbi:MULTISPECIES: type 1 glutamine amidotransferase domain-containing protein [Streptomyces]|uniref:type 1 glutamine amidotransferase domain-containing protein n=1 Tax=Streptomyces TaxID=1883 RepID=UPI001C2E0AC2|nr:MULTISPECIES: type 1 glutamine amidotransferase domain-containing protein [Streptomyces]MBV1948693.1 type 1 glutamine amidotransferase [Streptomyces sp. BV129]
MALDGKSVLVLTTNYGTEQDELLKPVAALREAGARVVIAAQKPEAIATLVSDKDPGDKVEPDTTLAEATSDGHDAVVIPGGTLNADQLRVDADAQRLVTAFAREGKPVAAICHGPWLLVNTELAEDRDMTSYPSLLDDLVNAGATWTDQEVVVDTEGGHPLITSRNPGDLDAFSSAIIRSLGGDAG